MSADSCAKLSSAPTPLGARLELYVGRIDGRVRFWSQRTTPDGAQTTVFIDSTRRAEEYYRAAEEHPEGRTYAPFPFPYRVRAVTL